MFDADAQNNKRLGPGSSASGLLTDPKPTPKTNSQTLNLDVPAITNLNLIPSVPVLPRPPYRFHPDVYKVCLAEANAIECIRELPGYLLHPVAVW